MQKHSTTKPVAYTSDLPRTPLWFLWYVTKPVKWHAILGLIIVISAATADTMSILIVQNLIQAAESGNHVTALWLGLLYPVVILVIQLVWRITGLLGRHWAVEAQKMTADSLFAYASQHSHGYYADRFAGSLMNKVRNVASAMESLIADILWRHLERLVGFVASFFIILFIDIWVGLMFLGLVVALIGLNYFLVPRKQRYSLEWAESRTRLGGRIVDVFTNISATRQYAREHFELRELDTYTRDSRDRQSISWLYTEYMLFVNSLVIAIFSILMFLRLADQWLTQNVHTAEFVTVMVLMFQLADSMIFIGRAFNDTATAYGEAAEGLDELVIDHEVTDAPNAKALKVHTGAIDWNAVTFEYGNNQVFTDFMLKIPAGQRVGLVGHSGAGKTTFVSLLLRQHDLQEGAIEIDGQDIASVTQDSLRKAIAVVPQEPLLFHRTIKENIAYGKPKATLKEIEAVAKKAQAHDFIKELEHGYDTLVGERGVKLSGGQKQRIAIARAMLKDAPILILDEATSALDSESEVEIQKALHELMVGKTVVAVAHRLSTLREMDRIIVLENGQIIEDGMHNTLVNQSGIYAKLWAHQAGGFLQE